MSVTSEISRLQTAKADLKTAIEGKGVTVPSSATLDDYADLVDEISGGGNMGYVIMRSNAGALLEFDSMTYQLGAGETSHAFPYTSLGTHTVSASLNGVTKTGSITLTEYTALEYSLMLSRIPDEYQEVEYIESNGDEFINLSYGFSPLDELEAEAAMTVDTTDKFICAPTTWNDSNNRFALWGCSSSNFGFAYGTSSTQNTVFNISKQTQVFCKVSYRDYKFSMVLRDFTSEKNVSSVSFGSDTKNLKLFFGYSSPSTCRIKVFRHKRAGNLLHDLVPCYKKSNDIVGMYDLVNDVFLTNAGSGAFIAGPNVL